MSIYGISSFRGGFSPLCAKFRQLKHKPEGLIDGFRSRERLGNIGGQKDKVRPFPKSLGVLALDAPLRQLAEIILRPQIIVLFVF